MNARAIRNWLLIQPRAVSLVLKTGDDKQEIVPEEGQTWAALASSIEAIDPDSIEIYDAKGKLIRAAKRAAFDALPEDEVDTATAAAATKKVFVDAETERFKIFADHLAEAYRFATGIAFERMVDLFAAVNKRSESLENSLDRTHKLLKAAYQEQVDSALEKAEETGEPNLLNQMLGQFVAAKAQGAVESVASPTNGKAAKA